MCIYIYIYTHLYVYIYIYIYTHMYIRTSTPRPAAALVRSRTASPVRPASPLYIRIQLVLLLIPRFGSVRFLKMRGSLRFRI